MVGVPLCSSQSAQLNVAFEFPVSGWAHLISGLDDPAGLSEFDLLCFLQPKFTFIITCFLLSLAAQITTCLTDPAPDSGN